MSDAGHLDLRYSLQHLFAVVECREPLRPAYLSTRHVLASASAGQWRAAIGELSGRLEPAAATASAFDRAAVATVLVAAYADNMIPFTTSDPVMGPFVKACTAHWARTAGTVMEQAVAAGEWTDRHQELFERLHTALLSTGEAYWQASFTLLNRTFAAYVLHGSLVCNVAFSPSCGFWGPVAAGAGLRRVAERDLDFAASMAVTVDDAATVASVICEEPAAVTPTPAVIRLEACHRDAPAEVWAPLWWAASGASLAFIGPFERLSPERQDAVVATLCTPSTEGYMRCRIAGELLETGHRCADRLPLEALDPAVDDLDYRATGFTVELLKAASVAGLDDAARRVVAELWSSWTGTLGELRAAAVAIASGSATA